MYGNHSSVGGNISRRTMSIHEGEEIGEGVAVGR